jgi:salicylate hydroxylase
MINIAAFVSRHHLEGTPYNGPWVATAEKDEFLKMYANWEPEVLTLLRVCAFMSLHFSGTRVNQWFMLFCFQSADTASRWSIHTVKPLSSFVSSRVVLIGDAVRTFVYASERRRILTCLLQAHGGLPTQGSGAGQAIEVSVPQV